MTLLPRRRWLAPALALSLGLGVVGGLAAPATAATSTFTQNTPLFIGDDDVTVTQDTDIAVPAVGDIGQAGPYPSQVTYPNHGALITDVDVSLTLTSTAPTDLDVLLVGPGGQQALIMSDVGGGTDVSNINLTLSDQAAASMTTASLVGGGTFKPTNLGVGDAFNAPAPAPSGNTSLSVFNGTNPAGAWSLYVMDDAMGDTHTISDWSLDLATETTPYPSTVDVSGVGPISDVNVTLAGFTSTYPDDISLLLVGPSGQQSILMSDVGGGTDVTNATFVVDDEAPTDFPLSAALVPGSSYRPTNDGAGDTWPAPAPVATGNLPLSIFDGLSPNGTWKLYALDCCSSDLTSIGSWSLQFTWADTQAPSGTVSVNGGAATTNSQNVTLSLNATDPAPATGVTQMRFSNDGVTFSAYQAYATSAAWTVASGDGVKTVYAQFKDAEGNQSAVVSDAITLALPDTTGPSATKTTPKKNAKGVKVTTKVKVKASEALKGKTVNAKTVFLKAKGSSKKVKAKVSYNAKGKTIVLTPKTSLKKGTKYTMTVTTKVKDAAGNAFDGKPKRSGAQVFKFSFTTA